MNSEDKPYKSLRNGTDLNPISGKNAHASLLDSALNNPVRRQHGFNVLFADINKAPRREWIKWQSQPQSDDDVRALFSTWKPGEATCWGFVCGYNGLEAIDFDWAWVYRLWKSRFGDRAGTLTVQTPNGGFRPFYLCAKTETNDKFKETIHVELKGPGCFVVYEGKAKREDGTIGEYQVVNDKPIRTDENIIYDTLAFLEEIYKRYSFLRWNCMRPHFSKKKLGDPSHELRLYISDVMVCEGFSDEEVHNLFRDFSDYDYQKTQEQIDYTRLRVKAGLKPPTCDTLRQGLGWSEENCKGCSRKSMMKPKEGTSLGEYQLELKGSTVVVVDKSGEPVWSTKATSLTGLQTKRDLVKKLKLEEDVVDRAVAKFMVQVAEEPVTPKTGAEPPPEELIEKSKKLLKDPKSLCTLELAFREQGLVGETKNAFATFFDMLSTLTQNPCNKRWSGRSGVGKSAIVTKVAAVFPPEMLIMRAGLSKKTVWHMPGSEQIDERTRVLDLKGKILIVLEESESKEFLDEVKPLLSHDLPELKYEWTEKTDEGLTTFIQILRGWPAYIGITTTPELREEQQTRALIGTPDQGERKYKSVIAADAFKMAVPWQIPTAEHTMVVQEAIRQLKPMKVWIPWLPLVAEAFPSKQAKSMREWFFFRSLLESITLWFQYILPHVIINGEEYVCAPPFILELGLLIGEAAFMETITGLEKDVADFIEYLRTHGPGPWTYQQLLKEYRDCFGESISKSTLKRRYIDKLVDQGLLDLDDSTKPYSLSLGEKSSTTSSILGNVLEIVRSDKIKLILSSKTSCTSQGIYTLPPPILPDGKTIPWEQFWDYVYSLDVIHDIKELLSRSKEKDYPEFGLFSDLHHVVDDSGGKKPVLSLSNSTSSSMQQALATFTSSTEPKKITNIHTEVVPEVQVVPSPVSPSFRGEQGTNMAEKNGEKSMEQPEQPEQPLGAIRLVPSAGDAHVPEEREKPGKDEKKLELDSSEVQHGNSAVQYIASRVEDMKKPENQASKRRTQQEQEGRPVWFYRKIPPGERCELCGRNNVEYELESRQSGLILRRCEQCYRDLSGHSPQVIWINAEEREKTA